MMAKKKDRGIIIKVSEPKTPLLQLGDTGSPSWKEPNLYLKKQIVLDGNRLKML